MENFYYIGQTNVGKGLFAKRLIRKGEKILKFSGKIVSGKEAEKLDLENYGLSMGNPLQIGKDKYIYLEEPGRIINHSCNPNAGIVNDVYLVAIKNIKKGEEIRYDYSPAMDEDDWTMQCKCGEKNCRGVVKDFKYLPEKVQKKYLNLGVVQRFIAKKFA
ncbi:MAG: SET domain-containing protein-lysine N-methyltransferase [archaeon]